MGGHLYGEKSKNIINLHVSFLLYSIHLEGQLLFGSLYFLLGLLGY